MLAVRCFFCQRVLCGVIGNLSSCVGSAGLQASASTSALLDRWIMKLQVSCSC